MPKNLSKSNYIIGSQCPKLLWTLLNEPDKIPETDEGTQYRFDQGHLVGELAKKLWHNGKSIDPDFKVNARETMKALSLRVPLFEAGFFAGGMYARADVLEPTSADEWNIIEVKSSTRVKDENIEDVAFQRYCYEKAGLKIKKCFLMYINNKYVKNGEIIPQEFFLKDDITASVDEVLLGIEDKINPLLEILSATKCPEVGIGRQCNEPYTCPLKEFCWSFLPENNVFDLCGRYETRFELFNSGILALKDIPEEYKLNGKQKIQCQCEKSGTPFIDKPAIKKFLGKLKYPLYFLDFETYGVAIPFHNGMRPYQNIPFQFSLHIVEEKGAKPRHYSYLTEGAKDTRKEIAENLKELLGSTGSIIAYNKTFEEARLKELAESFPEYKKWVDSILKRTVDLLAPFRQFSYYNPLQKGSASIKDVLPALIGKSYDEMEISGGENASLQFLYITYGNEATPEEVKEVRQNLENYCGLDTEGMIWIVEKLEELVEGQ